MQGSSGEGLGGRGLGQHAHAHTHTQVSYTYRHTRAGAHLQGGEGHAARAAPREGLTGCIDTRAKITHDTSNTHGAPLAVRRTYGCNVRT
jgi:hypothetical protein